jgi:hypothetical protein
MSVQKDPLKQAFDTFSATLVAQAPALNVEKPQVDFFERKVYAHVDTDTQEVKFFKATYNLNVCFEYSLTLSGTQIFKAAWYQKSLQTESDLNIAALKQSFTTHETTLTIANSFADLLVSLTENWDNWVAGWIKGFIGDPGKAGFEFIILYLRVVLADAELNTLPAQINSNTSNSSVGSVAKLETLAENLKGYLEQADSLVTQRKAYSVTPDQLKLLKDIIGGKLQTIQEALASPQTVAVSHISSNNNTQEFPQQTSDVPVEEAALIAANARIEELEKALTCAQETVKEAQKGLSETIQEKIDKSVQQAEKEEEHANKKAILEGILSNIQSNCLSNTEIVKNAFDFSDETLNSYIIKQQSHANQSYVGWAAGYAASFVVNTFTTEKARLTGIIKAKIDDVEKACNVLSKELDVITQELETKKTAFITKQSEALGDIQDLQNELQSARADYKKLSDQVVAERPVPVRVQRVSSNVTTATTTIVGTSSTLEQTSISAVADQVVTTESSTNNASASASTHEQTETTREFSCFLGVALSLLRQLIDDLIAFLESKLAEARDKCASAVSDAQGSIGSYFSPLFSKSVSPSQAVMDSVPEEKCSPELSK